MNQLNQLLSLPEIASEHGGNVDKLIIYIHVLMGVLFVGWLAYFLFVLFRFRATKHPRASYGGAQTHASSYIEAAVAILELAILVILAIPLWANLADRFPPESEATVIRVVAEQFAWNGLYPGKDGKFGRQDLTLVNSTNQFGKDFKDPATADDFSAPLNEITVPVNKPVIAYITSKDVIHSFKVTPMRITQDAIPGLQIPIHFKPIKAGEYLINCAQLCGNSHYFMKGRFRVLSQEAYDAWSSEKQKSAAASAGGFE
jgi:cytochrome c oxidase subunit II